jgi:hypothetical protein
VSLTFGFLELPPKILAFPGTLVKLKRQSCGAVAFKL